MRLTAVLVALLLAVSCTAAPGPQDQESEARRPAAVEPEPMTLFLCLGEKECHDLLAESQNRAAASGAPLVVFAVPVDGASRDFALRLAQLYAIEPVAAQEVLEAMTTYYRRNGQPMAVADALALTSEGVTGVSTLGPPPQEAFEGLLAAVLDVYHQLGGTHGPLLVEGELSLALPSGAPGGAQ